MKKHIACALAAGLATSVFAQPGDRTAIVYGARVAGDSQWHFGSLAAQSDTNAPMTIEVGAFCFRSQGVGLATAVFKTYINTPLTNGIAIVEDLSNGVPSGGPDGRVGVWNGPTSQFQKVFTNRHSSIPGTGYRIATGTGGPTDQGDTTDSGAAGGISVHQSPPANLNGDPNPNYVIADGVLTYRFNVIAIPSSLPDAQSIRIFTPLSRVASYNIHTSRTPAPQSI